MQIECEYNLKNNKQSFFFVLQRRHKYKCVYLCVCVCAGVCTSVDCIAITRIAINNLFASQLMHQIDVIHVLKSFRMTCAPSARPLHFTWYIQRWIHISHGGVTNCPSRVAIVVAACQTGTCHRQTMQLSLSKTKQQNVDHINCTDAVNCGQWNRQAGSQPDRQTDRQRVVAVVVAAVVQMPNVWIMADNEAYAQSGSAFYTLPSLYLSPA